jgi:hypothetical protein
VVQCLASFLLCLCLNCYGLTANILINWSSNEKRFENTTHPLWKFLNLSFIYIIILPIPVAARFKA